MKKRKNKMTKAEKRQQRIKERYDLNSQFKAELDAKKLFICNPTGRTISKGVESNYVNWFRLGREV
jgi:hypothetical protein